MWQEKPIEMDVEGDGEEEYDEGKDLRKRLDEVTATLTETGDQAAAITGYGGVLNYESTNPAGPSDSVGKVKEEAIYGLAKAYADSRRSVSEGSCLWGWQSCSSLDGFGFACTAEAVRT